MGGEEKALTCTCCKEEPEEAAAEQGDGRFEKVPAELWATVVRRNKGEVGGDGGEQDGARGCASRQGKRDALNRRPFVNGVGIGTGCLLDEISFDESDLDFVLCN